MNTPSFKLPESYSFKSIWRITFPILVALVMEELLGMTDTAFLGRVCLRFDAVALGIYAVYCTIIIGILHSDIAICWTADGVYSLCIWIQCVVYIHRKKWQNKTI